MEVVKFVSFGYKVQNIAARFGWLPGARYTNLRDVRRFDRLGFLDIEWRDYDFRRHLSAAASTKPLLTVARDVERPKDLDRILDQASELSQHCGNVIIVPKHKSLAEYIEDVVPKEFLFGYSVPTRYGGTRLSPNFFVRKVHLLGGRPDVQRRLAGQMRVVSLDCNRFALDARYG